MIRQAVQAGKKLPKNAVPPPTAKPHHQAAVGIKNFGKNAMGNGMPPATSFTISHELPALINPDSTVTYAPAAGFSGHDKFTYTISDGKGGTAVGTVGVNVARK